MKSCLAITEAELSALVARKRNYKISLPLSVQFVVSVDSFLKKFGNLIIE